MGNSIPPGDDTLHGMTVARFSGHTIGNRTRAVVVDRDDIDVVFAVVTTVLMIGDRGTVDVGPITTDASRVTITAKGFLLGTRGCIQDECPQPSFTTRTTS